MKPATRAEFLRVFRRLRAVYPPPRPVRVRQIANAPDWGLTSRTRSGYTITLCSSMPLPLLEYVAIEEWAHVVAPWRVSQISPDHGPMWGAAMWTIYCAFHGVQ